MAARSIFIVGKGGVGKSTLAALTALAHAGAGRRVLLLSLDPAHNQSDIFARSIGEHPTELKPGLHAVEPDAERWIRRYLTEVERRVQDSYTYLTTLNLEHHFRVLRHSPGLEEFALRRMYEHLRDEWSHVDILVADMPPTALATRFFASPSIALAWTEELLSLRREIRSRREMITRIKVGTREFEQDRILRTLEQETAKNAALRDHFADADQSEVRLVINPDPLSWNEGIRIRDALEPLGIAIGRLIINRVRWNENHPSPDDELYPEELSDLPNALVPAAERSPTGIDALSHLLDTIDRDALG